MPEDGDSIGLSKESSIAEVGQQWTPEEFVEQTKALVHPFDQTVQFPPATASVLLSMAQLGPASLVRHRERQLSWWQARARELEQQESRLHSLLHPEVESVVKEKRIIVFHEMLRSIQYDDMGVVEILKTGVSIVGTLPLIGIWKPEDRAAKLSEKALIAGATLAQAEVAKGRQSSEHDEKVWATTLEEVAEGCLDGPFSKAQLDEEFGSRWIPSRRFAVVQGSKVRPIDNFSEFGINDAFGSCEKVLMLNLDHVVGWAKAWSGIADDKSAAGILDTAGHWWRGNIHKDWAHDWGKIHGRVADLKSAYKQLAIRPEDSHLSVVAVQRPDDREVVYFKARSLMFGETAAVYSFLRFRGFKRPQSNISQWV